MSVQSIEEQSEKIPENLLLRKVKGYSKSTKKSCKVIHLSNNDTYAFQKQPV